MLYQCLTNNSYHHSNVIIAHSTVPKYEIKKLIDKKPAKTLLSTQYMLNKTFFQLCHFCFIVISCLCQVFRFQFCYTPKNCFHIELQSYNLFGCRDKQHLVCTIGTTLYFKLYMNISHMYTLHWEFYKNANLRLVYTY